jgi:hypothetical protein
MYKVISATIGGTARATMIRVPRGETLEVELDVVDADGAPYSLAGVAIVIGVGVLSRSAVNIDEAAGKAVAAISSAETFAMGKGSFKWDAWAALTDGSRVQISYPDLFVVLDGVTDISQIAGAPISPFLGTSVGNVAELAIVDASRLGPGFVKYVVDAGGGVGAFFHIEVGKSLAVDHVTVEAALNLSDGQWVRGLG